jgi:hypothetical protein
LLSLKVNFGLDQAIEAQKGSKCIAVFPSYLGRMQTNDTRLPRENKSRADMAIVIFTNKKPLFTIKMDSKLSKKLVNSYIWSIALYGTESGYLKL